MTAFPSRAILSLLFLTGIVQAAERDRASFSLRTASETGMELLYTPTPKSYSRIRVDSTDHLFFTDAAFDTRPGSPSLPVDAITVGIPSDASVSAELVEAKYQNEGPSLIAPVPAYRNRDSSLIAVYKKDPAAYGINAFVPAQPIEVGQPFTIRGQRICTIRLAPIQYNPVTRVVQRLTQAKLRINFRNRSNRPQIQVASATPDIYFENFFRSLLVNYDQARMWRQSPPAGSAGLLQDTARTWFRLGQSYLRTPIVADGWYRLTKNDLTASGISPLQIDWPSMGLFSRGQQIPFHIGADSSIEFYAQRNYGDSTYYDFYTDTSIYWLTWGEPSSKQFSAVPQPPGAPSVALQSLPVTRHFEQNMQFFVGTTDAEVGQNSAVPGRGWLWEYYYPGSVNQHTFPLDSIDGNSYPTATVQVRLFSTTPNYAGDRNHKAVFWLNDSLLGQVYFAGRTGITFSAAIPVSWLRDGSNTITIKSDTSVGPANQFYLDWFEVTYGRYLKATGNQITFSSPASSSGITSFTVAGFTSPSISVFDPSTGRQLLGGTVLGDSVSGYRIAFQDTFSLPRTYVIVSDSGAMPTLPLSRKTFKDIRSNSQGADYIIITHSAFLPQAQQLATHRQITNGVRTAVVDVQDIYDEFNFGIMNGERLRDFLRYTHDFWPGAKPSYLLLFGDASWDFHHYLPTTVRVNYVPAYGVPAGDNWFVVFHPESTVVPSMFVGRLPVQNQTDAQAVVAKVITYDSYVLGEWNKNFLYITGGDDLNEQTAFNLLSDRSIGTYIAPPPIGGTPIRVYKNVPAVIDAGYKQYLKDLVKQGLSFISYIGHSGGRVLGVDIGSPLDLENTDGKLLFFSSVSCNVGAFAEPSGNVLAEDFVLAPNRGAIAAWASAALGYPYQGAQLFDFVLDGIQKDSLRDFGTLTTLARLRLWQQYPSFISAGDLSLTPLLGDPLSRLALPLKPDVAVASDDISLNRATPTLVDTTLVLRVNLHNFGLVPSDSFLVSIADLYNGHLSQVGPNRRVRPPLHLDSLFVPWAVASQPGKHTITVYLDPGSTLSEVSTANNLASSEIYIYSSELVALRPLMNHVVQAGPQTLVVTTPFGGDTTGYQYTFELDTVVSFDSPFKLSSGPIASGPVSGQWTTPILSGDRTFFWRARTVTPQSVGEWRASRFSTRGIPPAEPLATLSESSRVQFAQDELAGALPTDTGVVIAPQPPLYLYARSLGYRADLYKDYYSIIRVNAQTITGFWWHLGSSFMGVRVNEFTGDYALNAFDVSKQPSLADSMAQYIANTPTGNYLVFSVIYDGATNVNENLKTTLESLGSKLIRSVLPGQSWAFIARKGFPADALESLTNDSAVVSVQVPNFYGARSGILQTLPTPMPVAWHALHWELAKDQGRTDATLLILGIRNSDVVDTLRRVPSDSVTLDLREFTRVTSDTAYASFRLMFNLSTSDPLITPALKDWHVDLEPPGDLAISGRTVGERGLSVQKGSNFLLPVTVHNLGYRTIDSIRVLVSLYDARQTLHPLAMEVLDSIPPVAYRTLSVPIQTTYLSGTVTVNVAVSPIRGNKELTSRNNSADYSFVVTGNLGLAVQFYADGAQLMEGDYVSPNPAVRIRLPAQSGLPSGQQTVRFYADDALIGTSTISVPPPTGTSDDPIFSPVLKDGRHELRISLTQPNLLGGVDSLQQRITVNVLAEAKLLQVLNYPNPFSTETVFTFILTGKTLPEEVSIRIFTVAGRKIREISVPLGTLQIGFNRIPWDGRDADGDEIANGTYLYQVHMKSAGKTESEIGKLAKVR